MNAKHLNNPYDHDGEHETHREKSLTESSIGTLAPGEGTQEMEATSPQSTSIRGEGMTLRGWHLAAFATAANAGWAAYHNHYSSSAQPSVSLQACQSLGASEFQCIPALDPSMQTYAGEYTGQTDACTLSPSELLQATIIREGDGSLRIQAKEPLISKLTQCVSDTTHGQSSPHWPVSGTYEHSAHLFDENADAETGVGMSKADFGHDL